MIENQNNLKNARLYCDGACRGNPGPAGIGAVLIMDETNGKHLELSEYIGEATNNVAEYKSLILGLTKSIENNAFDLEIFLDSELVVRQITGQYRVKDPKMQVLYKETHVLLAQLSSYVINHVLREKNKKADALANKALDLAR